MGSEVSEFGVGPQTAILHRNMSIMFEIYFNSWQLQMFIAWGYIVKQIVPSLTACLRPISYRLLSLWLTIPRSGFSPSSSSLLFVLPPLSFWFLLFSMGLSSTGKKFGHLLETGQNPLI